MTWRPKKLIKALIMGMVFSFGLAAASFAGPFMPGEQPPPFPSIKLEAVDRKTASGAAEPEAVSVFEFSKPGQKQMLVRVSFNEQGTGTLMIPASQGRPEFAASIEGSALGEAQVWAADLNGDSVEDYLVITYSCGCGLASQITFTTFVLSAPGGRVAHLVYGFSAEGSDLLDIDRDGRPEFLHTLFVYGEPGRDGRPHNYWVYNLLGFSGTDIVSANARDARFPKWIWYKFKPTFEDTDQLTNTQRRRLWRETWKMNEGVYGDKPLFPRPEAFAEEQGRKKGP